MKVGKILPALIVGMMIASGLGIVSGIDNSGNNSINNTPNIRYNNAPPNYEPFASARTVLMEDNTNWGCGPCASHNPPWTACIVANGYSVVAPVYMHVDWPSSTDPWNNYGNMGTWANGRRSAEGCTYVPWPMIDGSYTSYGQSQATYQAEVNSRLAIQSRVAITTGGQLDYPSANQAFLDVHVEATENLPAGDWRIVVQIWENNCTRFGTGPNGESEYDWASWLFLDQDGTATNNHQGVAVWTSGATAGQSIDLTYNFNLETAWIRDEIGATVFLQNFAQIGGGESSPYSVEQAHVEPFDNSPPMVSLVSPAPYVDEQILSGSIPIIWSASDLEDPPATLDIAIDYSLNDGASWTNIMTGTNNNIAPYTYNWASATVSDDVEYILRVNATDSFGKSAIAISAMPFSIDNTVDDKWFFQVDTTASFPDLNMRPVEQSLNTASTGPVTDSGDYKIGTWQTTQTFTSRNINGAWTFNVYGRTPLPGVVPLQGYLYAKVFSSSNLATPIDTTILDNENVGAYSASHLFTWTETLAGSIAGGDSLVVEIWLSTTGGPYEYGSGSIINSGFDSGAAPWSFNIWATSTVNPTGTYMDTGGNPNGYVNINLPKQAAAPPGTYYTVAGYWQQSFTTGFAPTQATLSFDYACQAATSAGSILYVFVDTVAGNPTVGTQIWNTALPLGVTPWTSVGPLDISPYVNADTTYYLKIAFWHYARTTMLPCTAGYDNVVLTYETPFPWFEMEYDYTTGKSNVQPSIGIETTLPYNIALTGKSANSWVYVSFPITISGGIQTMLNDATLGDGATTWTVAKWYNPQTPADPWKTYRVGGTANDLTTINNQMGVWLWITANGGDQMLTAAQAGSYSGTAVTVNLYTGWNMVGYPTVTSRAESATLPAEADLVASWQAASPYITQHAKGATMMAHGNAYWVHVTADCVWTVNP